MRPSSNNPKIWPFLLLLGLCWLFSFGYIAYYAHTFDFPQEVKWWHMGLSMSMSLFGVVFGCLAMQWKRLASNNYIKYLWAFSWGLGVYLIALLYLLNYISLSEWGQNISWSIVSTFDKDVPALLEALPYNKLPVYLLLFGMPIVIFGLFMALANTINDGFIGIGRILLKAMRRPVILVLGMIVLGALGWHLLQSRNYIRGSLGMKGEPIYNFFSPVNPSFDGKQTLDLKTIEENKAALAEYQANLNIDSKNVVLIIVDALRTQNMGLHGYRRDNTPFLSQLDQAGSLQKAPLILSNCATSFCGILSVLNATPINELASTNVKIQDVFDRLGYKTHFLLVGSHNEWYQLRRTHEYHSEIDYYFDGLDSKQYEINDDRAIFEFLEQVPNFDGVPSFFYFHLMTVHKLGVKFDEEQYQVYQPSKRTSYLKPDSSIMVNNYDNSILQADDLIRQIYEHLSQKGFLEDCLLIITADHGEAMGEHGKFGHSYNLYQESIHIPLLFHDTQAAAEADLPYGTQIDIGPTILDKLNVPIPKVWKGRSLLQTPTFPHFDVLRQTRHQVIVMQDETGIYKYYYNQKTKTQELFEITSDPLEKVNLFDKPQYQQQQQQLLAKFKEEFG